MDAEQDSMSSINVHSGDPVFQLSIVRKISVATFIDGDLPPSRRYSVAMAESLISQVFSVVPRKPLNVESPNLDSFPTIWLLVGCVALVLVEKKIEPESPEEVNLRACLDVRTAGDPDDEAIIYTSLSRRELSDQLTEIGIPVGRDAIATWLDNAGIRRRQIRKDLAGGEHPDRDAQFNRIAELIDTYESEGNPWFSMDTKAKEHLG